MKWKGHPTNMDVKILLQLINTHGTEIAPGSDIIRKDFNNHRFSHRFLLSIFSLSRFIDER